MGRLNGFRGGCGVSKNQIAADGVVSCVVRACVMRACVCVRNGIWRVHDQAGRDEKNPYNLTSRRSANKFRIRVFYGFGPFLYSHMKRLLKI